jgi:hypothetical protein
VEVELHAVWISHKRELIDVSPQQIDFREIMFVPDLGTVYRVRQIDNSRIPLSKDLRVKEYI